MHNNQGSEDLDSEGIAANQQQHGRPINEAIIYLVHLLIMSIRKRKWYLLSSVYLFIAIKLKPVIV